MLLKLYVDKYEIDATSASATHNKRIDHFIKQKPSKRDLNRNGDIVFLLIHLVRTILLKHDHTIAIFLVMAWVLPVAELLSANIYSIFLSNPTTFISFITYYLFFRALLCFFLCRLMLPNVSDFTFLFTWVFHLFLHPSYVIICMY